MNSNTADREVSEVNGRVYVVRSNQACALGWLLDGMDHLASALFYSTTWNCQRMKCQCKLLSRHCLCLAAAACACCGCAFVMKDSCLDFVLQVSGGTRIQSDAHLRNLCSLLQPLKKLIRPTASACKQEPVNMT